MELRHLRYFEVVASTLNFTRAAEQLHIAQPPLSRSIQQLEEELGVTLIDRSARPIELTRAGAFFYEQCTQILSRIQALAEATQQLGAGRRRWIGVGFVPSMLYGPMPTAIQQFMARHPDTDVVLSELTSVQQAEALQAGRIDVGFGRVAIESEGLVSTLVEEEPLVAVLPDQAEWRRVRSVSLQMLATRTVVVYPAHPRPSFADQVLAQFRAHGMPLPRTYETNGLQTAIGLVAAGVGVSLVPSSVQRLQRNDILYRPIRDGGVITPTLMTTRVGEISADLKALCERVVAAAQSSSSPHTPPRRSRALRPAGARASRAG